MVKTGFGKLGEGNGLINPRKNTNLHESKQAIKSNWSRQVSLPTYSC